MEESAKASIKWISRTILWPSAINSNTADLLIPSVSIISTSMCLVDSLIISYRLIDVKDMILSTIKFRRFGRCSMKLVVLPVARFQDDISINSGVFVKIIQSFIT